MPTPFSFHLCRRSHSVEEHRRIFARGTDGSNPVPSSGESRANRTPSSRVQAGILARTGSSVQRDALSHSTSYEILARVRSCRKPDLVDGKPSRSIEGLPIKPVEVRREKPMRNRMAEFDHIRLCHRQEPTLTPPASIVRRRSLLPLTAIRRCTIHDNSLTSRRRSPTRP
jgi:hypothetical protein